MSETLLVEKKEKFLGRPLKTKEAYRHVRGKGKFVDDIRLPNTLYAAIARSQLAHARIKKIDYRKALELPGVVDVLTPEDVVKMSDPLPQMTVPPASNIKDYPIAVGKVRYVGEPIAVVVAERREIAEDAAELIEVDYEPLLPVVDAEEALLKPPALVHEEVGSNIMAHIHYSYGNIEKAMKEADRIINL